MREGLLVPSSISGRYALDHPDGPELTGGVVIEVFIAGSFMLGRVEHATGYNSPGCYSISDRGRSRKDTRRKTQEEMQRSVSAALCQCSAL